ncbi:hypothetical protein [Actinoallomurus iriomotensis]|uniref:Uncharacterized protein n=1 Tax=Actinoallomurus iriomotensis TaxID=478107 RepID=A0A9W6VV98_9ACTN|nr:hypothetical protein [Actinoallomurus iriomotensis]GLY81575.1 hypothetical protein Airi01_098420 [Actinoallomurus iriomotensis]
MNLDINPTAPYIPGIAEAEAEALADAVERYEDALEEYRDVIADDWQDRAIARETALTAREVAENGKRDDKRPPELTTASVKRAEALARLGVIRAEVSRCDTAAKDAIREQVPADVAPSAERVRDALAAYEAAIEALVKAEREAREALSRAVAIRHIADGGSLHQDPGVFAGDHAFGSASTAVAQAREVLIRAQNYATRKVGVR